MKTLLEQFADFASKQTPREKYTYSHPQECAVAQFCESLGLEMSEKYGAFLLSNATCFGRQTIFDQLEDLALEEPHNWSGLHRRIREAINGDEKYNVKDSIRHTQWAHERNDPRLSRFLELS